MLHKIFSLQAPRVINIEFLLTTVLYYISDSDNGIEQRKRKIELVSKIVINQGKKLNHLKSTINYDVNILQNTTV